MTANTHSLRTPSLLDKVQEMSEANATTGSFDHSDADRPPSSSKKNTDLTSKRARIQAVLSPRSNANDKKTNPVLSNSGAASS
ncbi:unnamed protein product, partial [Rotaria magnacalcarata]